MVLLSVELFNEMVEMANKAEMYQDLWQSEVDDRQGNMMSADEALEELQKLKKARGSYNDFKKEPKSVSI